MSNTLDIFFQSNQTITKKNKINSRCINQQQFCRITFFFLFSKTKTNTIISELSNYLARKPPWNIWQSLISDINFRSEKQKYSIVIQFLVKYIFLWVQKLSLIHNAISSRPEENLLSVEFISPIFFQVTVSGMTTTKSR